MLSSYCYLLKSAVDAVVPLDGPVDVLDDALGGECPAALDVLEHARGVAAAARRIVERGPVVRRGDATEAAAAAVDVDLTDDRLHALPHVDDPDFLIGAVRVENDVPVGLGVQVGGDDDVLFGGCGESLGYADRPLLFRVGEGLEGLAVLADGKRWCKHVCVLLTCSTLSRLHTCCRKW